LEWITAGGSRSVQRGVESPALVPAVAGASQEIRVLQRRQDHLAHRLIESGQYDGIRESQTCAWNFQEYTFQAKDALHDLRSAFHVGLLASRSHELPQGVYRRGFMSIPSRMAT
jgi:hypothetical protein